MIRSAQGTTDRGQSEVLGVVLLLGIVGIAAISLLLVGGQAISETEQETEHESVEQSFVELSQTMATTADNGDVSQSVNIDAGEHGAVTKVNNGVMNISFAGKQKNISIGTIEYESDDGTKIAYESGGVFRETGNDTRLISTPNIHYDRDTATLTMPVVNVSSSTTLSSGPVRVDNSRTESVYSGETVEEENITIRVESDYYQGWKQFFEDRAGDTVVGDDDFGELEDADRPKGYVEARLGYDDVNDAFSSGVSIADDRIRGSHNPFGDVESGKEFPPLEELVDMDGMVNEFQENGSDISSSNDNEAGEYYSDGLNEDVSFDLSGGDALVVVDGDIKSDIHVTDCGGTDSALRIYSTGDLINHNNEMKTECGDVESLQIYGVSTMGVSIHASGGTAFEGLLYVPSDKNPNEDEDFDGWNIDGKIENYQVELQSGKAKFRGSIVANSVAGQSKMHDVNDISLEDSDIDIIPSRYEPRPQLTYLNVVEHKMQVNSD